MVNKSLIFESYTSNSQSNLSKLLAHGLITAQMGEVPSQPTLGFVFMAKKPPKEVYRVFPMLTKCLSSKPLNIFVDDALAKGLTRRSDSEQSQINEAYDKFFSEQGCPVYFASEMYKALGASDLSILLRSIGTKLTYSELLQLLPQEKRTSLDELTLVEPFHAMSELWLMDQMREYDVDTVMLAHSSQAILAAHRNINSSPLSGVFIPKLKEEYPVEQYIADLQQFQANN